MLEFSRSDLVHDRIRYFRLLCLQFCTTKPACKKQQAAAEKCSGVHILPLEIPQHLHGLVDALDGDDFHVRHFRLGKIAFWNN